MAYFLQAIRAGFTISNQMTGTGIIPYFASTTDGNDIIQLTRRIYLPIVIR